MQLHLFDAKKVAHKLHNNEVDLKERAYYLSTGFLVLIAFSYLGLTNANPLWSWLALFEGIALIAVTMLGFSKVYDAADGDNNQQFIAEFTCLYLPVTITTMLTVWGVYWALRFCFDEALVQLANSNLQIALNLARIGGSFLDLLTFVAVVMVQVVIFHRIAKLFKIVRGERKQG